MPPHIFWGDVLAGPVTAAYWIRKAAALAGDEKTGNAVGTILTAFLLPFILIIVCLCGMMGAAADHNRAAVELCFGDGAIPAAAPEEYGLRRQILREQTVGLR